MLDETQLMLQEMREVLKAEKKNVKNSMHKNLKEIEKNHGLKLTEDARNDIMRWLLDIKVASKV